LTVQKSQEKTVVTLDIGAFTARETCLKCSCHGEVYGSKELRALVPDHGTFGFDVIVHVGKSLFVQCLGVQEVVDELALRNISISPSEVAFLGKKFIAYLAHAQRGAREDIRDSMQKRGGYILHVDGTCEGSSPNLFCGLDELSNFVLDNIKIPSEKKELLVPFFERIKKHYGEPIALVHDMGKGILTAVEEVFPGILDFVCHFHFLRDIGKDLFSKEYKIVFDRLKKTRIRTDLRRRLKALEKKIADDLHALDDFKTDFDEGVFEFSRIEQVPTIATYALIQWIFDAPSTSGGYGFPFDCPHLAFYQRVKTTHGVLRQIMDILLRNEFKDNKPFYRLWRLLDKVVSDKKLAGAAISMEEKIPVFDELREAMRIALPDGKDGLNDDGINDDMSTIENAVKDFREQIISDDNLAANNEYLKMIAQIDKYWGKLFADPITVQTPCGPIVITPQRTNNILERFFRDLKRNGRKKTGSSSLSKMLHALLADTPLVANLKSEEYLNTILGDCKSLEQRFSQIDAAMVREYLANQHNESLKFSAKIKPLIKQEGLPDKLAQMFQPAKAS
jgi:mRNA-degrading endonuclease YafQ of YafQ-DinJ toxin-antitoxin module